MSGPNLTLVPINDQARQEFFQALNGADDSDDYGNFNLFESLGLKWSDLEPGDKGPKIKQLQEMLGVSATGYYNNDTAAAVIKFTRAKYGSGDTTVTKKIWDALKVEKGTGGESGGAAGILGLASGIFGQMGQKQPELPAIVQGEEGGWTLPWIIGGVAVTGLAIGGVIYLVTKD